MKRRTMLLWTAQLGTVVSASQDPIPPQPPAPPPAASAPTEQQPPVAVTPPGQVTNGREVFICIGGVRGFSSANMFNSLVTGY
jgi:hypothetical protein